MYDVTHYYLHHGQPTNEVPKSLKVRGWICLWIPLYDFHVAVCLFSFPRCLLLGVRLVSFGELFLHPCWFLFNLFYPTTNQRFYDSIANYFIIICGTWELKLLISGFSMWPNPFFSTLRKGCGVGLGFFWGWGGGWFEARVSSQSVNLKKVFLTCSMNLTGDFFCPFHRNITWIIIFVSRTKVLALPPLSGTRYLEHYHIQHQPRTDDSLLGRRITVLSDIY